MKHSIGKSGDSAGDAKDDYYEEKPIKFSTVGSTSETKAQQNFTVSGQGTTKRTYWPGGSAKGTSKPYQGSTRLEENTPATLAVGPASIPSKVTVDSGNNKITLGLNGKDYTFTLADSAGSKFDADGDGKYSQDELADALQDAIDNQAGEGFGGAVVEIKGNQFVITSRVGNKLSESGQETSIESYAMGQADDTFFEWLGKQETAAGCTTKMDVKSGIAMTGTGGDDIFEFTYAGKDGVRKTVSLDLMKDTETSPTDINGLVTRITQRLTEEGLADKVKVEKSGSKLKLSTVEAGENTYISYTSGSGSSISANAKAIFKDIDTPATDPAAKITLNQSVRSTPYGETLPG